VRLTSDIDLRRTRKEGGIHLLALIMKKMKNQHIIGLFVGWRSAFKGEEAMNKSFANNYSARRDRHDRALHMMMKVTDSRPCLCRELTLIFVVQTLHSWVSAACISMLHNWKFNSSLDGATTSAQSARDKMWMKHTEVQTGELRLKHEADVQKMESHWQEEMKQRDMELDELRQWKQNEISRITKSRELEEKQQGELNLLTTAHSQEVEKVRLKLQTLQDAQRTGGIRIQELEEALREEKKNNSQVTNEKSLDQVKFEAVKLELDSKKREVAGLEEDLRCAQESSSKLSNKLRSSTSEGEEREGELAAMTQKLKAMEEEIEATEKDGNERKAGLELGLQGFSDENLRLKRQVDTLCIRSRVLEATIGTLTDEVAAGHGIISQLQATGRISCMVSAGISAVYRKCVAFNAWRPVLAERRYAEHYDELEANNNHLQQQVARGEAKLHNMEQQLRLVQALAPSRPDQVVPPPATSTPSTSREPYHHKTAPSQYPQQPSIDVPKTDRSVSRVWERDQALLQEYLERTEQKQASEGRNIAPAY